MLFRWLHRHMRSIFQVYVCSPWTTEGSFISSCQCSTMKNCARLQRSHADLNELGSLLPLISLLSCLINYHHIWWLCRGGMICLVLNGCHHQTVVKEMKNESDCSLVWLTSKLEILTYLYSESVSSTGQRLQQRSRVKENKYHYGRANIWCECREWHCSAPSTIRVSKPTTICTNTLNSSNLSFLSALTWAL